MPLHFEIPTQGEGMIDILSVLLPFLLVCPVLSDSVNLTCSLVLQNWLGAE